MLLSEVAKISSGFLFRGEKKFSGEGSCFPVIQANDISDENAIQWDLLKESVIDMRKTECVVQEGDVLVRSKGQPHAAILVDHPSRDAVVGSQFFILRVNGNKVLPEYLAWYLNQKPAQGYLNQLSAGTNIKHINKKTLSALEIQIPDLTIQKKIVQVYNLGQKEKGLLAQIQDRREKLLQAQLLSVIENH
jgi:restriction endonuclease S subunit